MRAIRIFITFLILFAISLAYSFGFDTNAISKFIDNDELNFVHLKLKEIFYILAVILVIFGSVLLWFLGHFIYECLSLWIRNFINDRKIKSDYEKYDKNEEGIGAVEQHYIKRALFKALKGHREGITELKEMRNTETYHSLNSSIVSDLLKLLKKYPPDSQDFEQILTIICDSFRNKKRLSHLDNSGRKAT